MIEAVMIIMMFWADDNKMVWNHPKVLPSVEICEASKETVMNNMMKERIEKSPKGNMIPDEILVICHPLPGLNKTQGI